MPKLASVPALNKEGFSRVTYLGLEDCQGKADEKTGEIREYTKLKFTILDKTKLSPISANVIGQALNERELWETVQGMGYIAPETEDSLDDGDDDLSDEPAIVDDELDSIVNYLEGQQGKHFLCKVERDKRGYWAIKPETLTPYVK